MYHNHTIYLPYKGSTEIIGSDAALKTSIRRFLDSTDDADIYALEVVQKNAERPFEFYVKFEPGSIYTAEKVAIFLNDLVKPRFSVSDDKEGKKVLNIMIPIPSTTKIQYGDNKTKTVKKFVKGLADYLSCDISSESEYVPYSQFCLDITNVKPDDVNHLVVLISEKMQPQITFHQTVGKYILWPHRQGYVDNKIIETKHLIIPHVHWDASIDRVDIPCSRRMGISMIGGLIEKDETRFYDCIVIDRPTIRIEYSYPFQHAYWFEEKSPNGTNFTLGDLVNVIILRYKDIFTTKSLVNQTWNDAWSLEYLILFSIHYHQHESLCQLGIQSLSYKISGDLIQSPNQNIINSE